MLLSISGGTFFVTFGAGGSDKDESLFRTPSVFLSDILSIDCGKVSTCANPLSVDFEDCETIVLDFPFPSSVIAICPVFAGC